VLIHLPESAVVRRISPARFERHHRAKYRAPVRKLAYFALREGVGAALRKARSKQVERAIENAQDLLVAQFELHGRSSIAVSRTLTDPARIDPRLVFPNPEGLSPHAIELSDRAVELLESYLPVPGCPVPDELVKELRRSNPTLGVPERAARAPVEPRGPAPTRPVRNPARAAAVGRPIPSPGVYLMGFGGYVREYVLPRVRGLTRAALDHKAELIRRYARPAFPVVADPESFLDAVASDPRPLVVVSTYHAGHVADAVRVLEANPRACVFIEKPAAVELPDAMRLVVLRRAGSWIDVGYNRRWAPLALRMKDALRSVPAPWNMTVSVKELRIPSTHWYRWPNQGTRITGNACHWIDLAHFLNGTDAVEVRVEPASGGAADDLGLSLRLADGSTATIAMTDRGDDLPGVTETIRVVGGEARLSLDDFRRLSIRSGGRTRTWSRLRRDKGHAAMYRALLTRWREGNPPAYPTNHLEAVCRATAAAVDLRRSGDPDPRALMVSPAGG